MSHYQYYTPSGGCSSRGQWLCPSCREEVQPVDIENFHACPYCEHVFRRDDALEDYVLSSLVRQWALKSRWPDGRNS